MNIHNKHRTIYFARSGQSLIEHSYKADSDLSPAGWDYAERLKEAGQSSPSPFLLMWLAPSAYQSIYSSHPVLSRRRHVAEERRKSGEKVDEDRKLVVSAHCCPP